MDARSYRHEAQNEHIHADSLRKQAKLVQQGINNYTRGGDFDHARVEQDRVAKLEEQAISHDKRAIEYEQQAAKFERQAAELDRQLSQLKTHYEQQGHDLENKIRQLLG